MTILTCKASTLLIYPMSVDDVDQRTWDTKNNKSEHYGNSESKRLGDTRV